MKNFSLPEIPRFSNEELEKLYSDGDILHPCIEALRSLGVAALTTTNLRENSDDFKKVISSTRWRVCHGHLLKAIRLMMGVLDLSSKGKYGESVNLLAHQAQKTIIQGWWLTECSEEEFDKYMIFSLSKEKDTVNKIYESGIEPPSGSMDYYQNLFKNAGYDVEKFEIEKHRLPHTFKMLSELNADQKLFATYEVLGFHHVNTTYVDIVKSYFDEDEGVFEAKDGHTFPKSYHLASIGLPFCKSIQCYLSKFYSLEEVKLTFGEYFGDFYEWFEELNDFLFKRAVSGPEESSKEAEKKKMESSLQDHARVKKELLPPFMKLNNLTLNSWRDNRLPEMLWAMALINGLGRDKALAVFRKIVNLFMGNEDLDGNATFSGISKLDDTQRQKIFSIFKEDKEIIFALSHLKLLPMLPGLATWPLEDISDENESWSFLAKCITLGSDHQTQESTDCRWVKMACYTAVGKMRFPTKDHYREIFEYPNFGDQKKSGRR